MYVISVFDIQPVTLSSTTIKVRRRGTRALLDLLVFLLLIFPLTLTLTFLPVRRW